MNKTRKTILKRFKITKTGKVLARPVGQNHFLAKQKGKKRRLKRKLHPINPDYAKALIKMLKK